jgi:hypothetical protein
MCNVFNEKQLNNNIYKVFESLTKYKYIQNKVFMESKLKKKIKQDTKAPIFKTLKGSFSINHSGKGIPQGSPISGLLANIYLVDFDLAMKASFKDIFYRRYSDDIVTVCPLGEKNEVLSFIDKKIKEQKVEINPKKTFITYLVKNGDRLEITSVTNGLNIPVGRKYVDYLGFEFDGSNVLLRKNTVQKLKYKQQKKVLKQLKNTISPKKKKKRKSSKLQKKSGRGNYFERSSAIFGDESIKQQVLRVVKKRNKLKKVARK